MIIRLSQLDGAGRLLGMGNGQSRVGQGGLRSDCNSCPVYALTNFCRVAVGSVAESMITDVPIALSHFSSRSKRVDIKV